MRRNPFLFLFLLVALCLASCTQEKFKIKTVTDANGYTYETVTNDPMKVRIYTLKNGLKVYLSENKESPRIQTIISIHAGSTSDPIETTGLAHYLEHMMFKGTNKIGTTDWKKEKVLLDEISNLFEKRRATSDSIGKVKIFAQIDSVSVLASAYAIPNENDKMINTIGAQGTNAFTNFDGTAYLNDIPSNEIEKWLKIERERFSNLALRLFHTELEAVYEEFNMRQDMDDSKIYEALLKELFKKNPLGRPIIGLPEHLKNPSLVNIQKFFATYYVPNNMAIIMCGNMDLDKTIQMIDHTFGQFQAKPFERSPNLKEGSVTKPMSAEVFGPDAESFTMAFRCADYKSEDRKYVTLIDRMLSNNAAGLIDLNLVQQQRLLKGGSYADFYADYGLHAFWAIPKQGQSLDTVKNLLLSEIEKIKKGEFPDWLLQAAINDLKVSAMRGQESNEMRASIINNMFHKGGSWVDEVTFFDDLEKITKAQLVKFAKEHYQDNYVAVYKRQGEDKHKVQVAKPRITPVNINRDDQSEFFTELNKMTVERLKPVFVDFDTAIRKTVIKPGVELDYIHNITNELFELDYIIDMGKSNNKKLALAIKYLPYIGTDKYTPEQIQQEFYKLGLTLNVVATDQRSYVAITGLAKSFEQGIGLLDHFMGHAKADTSAFRKYVGGILKEREDNKKNKDMILGEALINYGKYGKVSPFTNILSETEMRAIDPNELTGLIREMYTYKHRVFYYGISEIAEAKAMILKYHKIPQPLKDYPSPTIFPELNVTSKPVYFVNYDIVQTNLLVLSKSSVFDPTVLPMLKLYNEYYGDGLSSIVFQEIREARGLAYEAYSYIRTPDKKGRSFYNISFVGTQADKIGEASSLLFSLLKDMKEDQRLFDLAKETVLKGIEADRITKTNIFWTYLHNLDRGITTDIRKEIYEKVPSITITDFKNYFDRNIKPENYTLLVVGKKDQVNANVLRKLGTYKELTLEEIFNY